LAAESNSDPSLKRELAAAYFKLANVLGDTSNSNVGNSKEALKDYHRAVELREAVVAALPSDRDAQRELAESYMALAKANPLDNKQYLDRAAAVLKPLSDSYPDDQKIKHALAKEAEFTGGFYALSGKWDDALTNYTISLTLNQSLAEKEPGNNDYQKDLAAAHKHMGSTLIMQKKLDLALQQYLDALAIDEKLISTDPLNASDRYSITFTYGDTGLILRQQGDIDGALTYYRKALAIRKALADADPNDSRARSGVAKTNTAIGHLLWIKKQYQEAIACHKEALAIRTALLRSDPTNLQRRFEAAQSQTDIAEEYEQLAFDPHISHPQRLALCRQVESLLKEALPVYREKKDKAVGFEVGELARAEETAKHCSGVLQQLRTADKN
jgi:tetratricopeptide (TPR) repeat protein